MIKAVVFDFRDTLLKVAKGYKVMNRHLFLFVRSRNVAISKKELERMYSDVIRSAKNKAAKNKKLHDAMPMFVGLLLKKLGIKTNKQESEALLKNMNDAFAASVSLYPDAKKLLKEIRRRKLRTAAVIDGTSYRERKIISRLGLKKYLDEIVISEEVGFNKFTDKPLRTALAKLRIPPQKVLVVGDRIDKDIVHANNLGCLSVKLVRNKGRYARLVGTTSAHKPKYEVTNLMELKKYL